MDPSSQIPSGKPKTVIVTGGAGGIGAQTVRTYNDKGYNVVIADLPQSESTGASLIKSLQYHDRAIFHGADIVNWKDMQSLFRAARQRFGQIDIVVANAGMMESEGFFEFHEDEEGNLEEAAGSSKVIDVNLKGTMNTLRMAMHAMSTNEPDEHGHRGSIVAIASTSGYFGGTGVVSYVSSKHGVVGLCRASQPVANKLGIRVNVVAPFVTPTHITAGYSEEWRKRGLPANTVEDVAQAIVETSTDPLRKGHSVMVIGKMVKEIEGCRASLTNEWLGEGIANMLAKGGKFFADIGGYPLPRSRS